MNSPYVSLFTGAGGLDAGLVSAGLTPLLAQDIDPHAVDTIRAAGHRVIAGDLLDVREEVLDAAGTDVFAVVGGPPCQSFSTAGKRGGVADPRGGLVYAFLDTALALAPRFIVMENVTGLRQAAGRGGRPLLGEVHDRLRAAGYTSLSATVNAADYGTPQYRQRVLVIASRDGEPVFVPQPTHFREHQHPAYRWRTVADAFAGLDDPGECAEFSDATIGYLRHVPPGGNWRDLPAELVDAAMGTGRGGGGATGYYRRLGWDVPSPTLVTSPAQRSTLLAHPTEDRPLSVREYARLQGFADDHVFCGPRAAKYRQIGNAVPVALGEAVGRMLVSVARAGHVVPTKRPGRGYVVTPD